MNQEAVDLLKSGAADKTADLIHKLAGPLCEEVGVFLGEKFRAYRTKNVSRIVEKTEHILGTAGLPVNPVPPRLLLPIIENCSVQDDEILQTLWAGLLATASHQGNSTLAAYIDTLKQLTPDEARFLEKLYADLDFNVHFRRVREMPIYPDQFLPRKGKPVQVSPDNFEHLGLFRRDAVVSMRHQSYRVNQASTLEDAVDILAASEPETGYSLVFTRYAVSFVEACHGPRKPSL
jgi:hypothetical protein